jgi:hypothetical protein
MAQWKEGREERIGNTVERADAPMGHFRPTASRRGGFTRPVRRPACPMGPHRAAPASCRSGEIRQRHDCAVYVDRPSGLLIPGGHAARQARPPVGLTASGIVG